MTPESAAGERGVGVRRRSTDLSVSPAPSLTSTAVQTGSACTFSPHATLPVSGHFAERSLFSLGFWTSPLSEKDLCEGRGASQEEGVASKEEAVEEEGTAKEEEGEAASKGLGERGEPVFGRRGEPVFGRRGEPVFGRRGEPVFGRRGEPVFGQRGEPVFGRRGEPVFGRRGEPVFGRRGEPVFGQRGEPVFGRRGEPVFGRRGEPVFGRRGEPVFGRRGEPVFGRRGEPVFGQRGEPVFGQREKQKQGQEADKEVEGRSYQQQHQRVQQDQQQQFQQQQQQQPEKRHDSHRHSWKSDEFNSELDHDQHQHKQQQQEEQQQQPERQDQAQQTTNLQQTLPPSLLQSPLFLSSSSFRELLESRDLPKLSHTVDTQLTMHRTCPGGVTAEASCLPLTESGGRSLPPQFHVPSSTPSCTKRDVQHVFYGVLQHDPHGKPDIVKMGEEMAMRRLEGGLGRTHHASNSQSPAQIHLGAKPASGNVPEGWGMCLRTKPSVTNGVATSVNQASSNGRDSEGSSQNNLHLPPPLEAVPWEEHLHQLHHNHHRHLSHNRHHSTLTQRLSPSFLPPFLAHPGLPTTQGPFALPPDPCLGPLDGLHHAHVTHGMSSSRPYSECGGGQETGQGAGHFGSGGGVAMATSQPSNASEWQLYNVLKRANLLQYYDTFIAQGGDDVQQLCEAGEDEFLEIMALVGMAAKPLHVRRLQKALQEWVANPAAFEANVSAGYPVVPITGPAPGSISAVVRDSVSVQVHSTQTAPAVVSATTWTPQAPSRSMSPSESVPSPSSGSASRDVKEEQDRGGSPMMQPVLLDSQINAIAMAAASLASKLPGFEPKDLNSKKPVNREIQNLITSTDSSANRLEELRKYAAIYGRFDSKRKNDRPMSLHEISVNEAAAQLCLHCPALLTRREDLFPLARQVVRDSGYQYSKGHSRAAEVVVTSKKARLDPTFQRHFDASFKNIKQELDKDQQEERMSAVAQELASIRQHQEQVRAELAVAREEQDFALTQKLQSELASLTTQQLQVLQEHSDALRRPNSRQNKTTQPKQNSADGGSRDHPSASSSPVSDSDSLNNLATATLDSLYAAFRNSNGTLFEEGLRIAQQYGMADFARELKELQSQNQGGSENGASNSIKELDQPFELKEIKPELDSGLGDDSLDGLAMASGPGAGNPDKTKNSNVQTGPSAVIENGREVREASPRSNTSSPSKLKGENADLKRKGDNLDLVPSRPPSRRSRSSQSSSIYSGLA